MARRKRMPFRKRKHSAVSFRDYSTLHEDQSFDDEDWLSERRPRKRICLAQSSLRAVQKTAKEEPSDSSFRTKTRNKRVMRSSNYVEQKALKPVMRKEVGGLSW